DLLTGFRGQRVELTFNTCSTLYHEVVSKCTLLHGRYLSTPWLTSPHLQTTFLRFFGRPPVFNYRRWVRAVDEYLTVLGSSTMIRRQNRMPASMLIRPQKSLVDKDPYIGYVNLLKKTMILKITDAQGHQEFFTRLSDWGGIEKARRVREFDTSGTCLVGKFDVRPVVFIISSRLISIIY
nr:embryogenesis-associated protein EMB8-like [Tanacetum cinerariifolium]